MLAPWGGLADSLLRLGQGWRLVTRSELSSDERELLGHANGASDVGALLLPNDDVSFPTKVVCEETANALELLRRPSSYAELAQRLNSGPHFEEVLGLVLDGVVEIELDRGFLSGPAAYPTLVRDAGAPGTEMGRTDSLSRDALRHVAALDSLDAERMALRLYLFNSAPLTANWHKMVPNDLAAERYLGLHESGTTRQSLERRWLQVQSADSTEAWSVWRPAGGRGVDRVPTRQPKIYLSPRPEDTPRCLAMLVDTLSNADVPLWLKVARSPRGLLRPDKIVLYPRPSAALEPVADLLAVRFTGMPSQGVPFTARFATDDALLSWGVDPPDERGQGSLLPRHSWRSWITARLASALIHARACGLGSDAWQFALLRMRCEGVDPSNWQPSADLWDAKWQSGDS